MILIFSHSLNCDYILLLDLKPLALRFQKVQDKISEHIDSCHAYIFGSLVKCQPLVLNYKVCSLNLLKSFNQALKAKKTYKM